MSTREFEVRYADFALCYFHHLFEVPLCQFEFGFAVAGVGKIVVKRPSRDSNFARCFLRESLSRERCKGGNCQRG